MSLQSELSALFGTSTVSQAERIAPDQVDTIAVQEAAGALLRLKGQVDKQAALVQAMSPETAAALCRWLGDPSFWSLVAGITRH